VLGGQRIGSKVVEDSILKIRFTSSASLYNALKMWGWGLK
jgi:hypothetical protein